MIRPLGLGRFGQLDQRRAPRPEGQLAELAVARPGCDSIPLRSHSPALVSLCAEATLVPGVHRPVALSGILWECKKFRRYNRQPGRHLRLIFGLERERLTPLLD